MNSGGGQTPQQRRHQQGAGAGLDCVIYRSPGSFPELSRRLPTLLHLDVRKSHRNEKGCYYQYSNQDDPPLAEIGHFSSSYLEAATERSCAFVRPGGLLAIALYRKTPLCPFWTRTKKLYTRASPFWQRMTRAAYKSMFLAALVAHGKNPIRHVRSYHSARGMSWHHDVHDWLGGYPHESAEPEAVKSRLSDMGFEIVRSCEKRARVWGLFGSHCDEFVAERLC